MMRAMNSRSRDAAAALAVAVALVLGVVGAAQAGAKAPHVSTGGVSRATATGGELTGRVTPNGIPVTYHFEYGPTTAYGTSTKPVLVAPPSPPKAVQVGQTVSGLHAGYHYRIVGVYENGSTEKVIHGVDKSFSGGKAGKLRFVISKEREEQITVSYGGDALLTGSLTGNGNANRPLTLQETPFPFTTDFQTVSVSTLTSSSGGFAVTVRRLTRNTEFRFLTSDLRPLYSPTLLVHVTPRITLHVRGSGNGTGLYRLYGTVTPARNGTSIAIQQLLPQKAGSKRSGPRAHSVGTGVLKKGSAGASRFSVIVHLSGTFRYRAYLRLPQGALDSGSSSNVLVRGPKASAKRT